jgi:hydrogenase-4 membrane subunit HyfE
MSAALVDMAAQGALPLAGAAMLVLALAVLVAGRVAPLAGLVAVQAACLALAALAQAWLQESWQLLAVAAGTLAAKSVALPRGLRALEPVLDEAPAGIPVGLALAGTGLAGLALAVMAPVVGPGLAAALAVMLAGWLATALRRDRAGQAAGVLVLENGLVLALVSVPVFPGVAALALATLALPGAAALVLVRRLLAAPPDAAEDGR